MFTKIMSQVNYKNVPLTPMSKKVMPKFYKTSVAFRTCSVLFFIVCRLSNNLSSVFLFAIVALVHYKGPSGLAFGITGFVLLCYVTEWRVVLQYVPYYNGKYTQMLISESLDDIQEDKNKAERKENAGRDFQQERDDLITDNHLNKEEIINLVASKI